MTEDKKKSTTPPSDDENSLESPGTVIDANSSSNGFNDDNSLESVPGSSDASNEQPIKHGRPAAAQRVKALSAHVNVYLLLFILTLLVAGVVILVASRQHASVNKPTTISGQKLDDAATAQLQGTETKVGDPKQTLSIESNAVFSGKVLVRDSLDVAGTIRVGGSVSLPGITVSGASSFDQITANNLSISGNTSIQGQLTVQKNLTVSGGATFGGTLSAPQLNIDKLQLNQDIQLNRHIDAGGGSPRISSGGGVGGGGTTSISGTDTAGTITINTGGGPPAGILANVTFTATFGQTPHVVITPVGSTAATLDYYVTRTTTGFAIGTANSAPGGVSFSFDYIVID